MARQIYADPGHFDEDSTCYYYEKAKSVRDVMTKGPREWLTYAIPNRSKRNNEARTNGEGDAVDLGLSVRWRTPTISEWEELLNPGNCSWEWTCVDGMNGYRITSKIPGFTGASIFLPAPDKNELLIHYGD